MHLSSKRHEVIRGGQCANDAIGKKMASWRSMDRNTKDILETVNFIKDRMLTKDDVCAIIREEVPGMIEAARKPIQ